MLFGQPAIKAGGNIAPKHTQYQLIGAKVPVNQWLYLKCP